MTEWTKSHPYIPNANDHDREHMLSAIGADSLDDLFAAIPADLRFRGLLDIPPAIPSEQDLQAHVGSLLEHNTPAGGGRLVSFLGGDCYNHYVPSVCDEINQRNEFLTSYSGRTYEDHGRYQALWEYASMMGDLLDMDVVCLPVYDGYQAAATSILMAARATGRDSVLIASTVSPDKMSRIQDYCASSVALEMVPYDGSTGTLDAEWLTRRLDDDVAAVYRDEPSFLGTYELNPADLNERIHRVGAMAIVGTDPMMAGYVTPPSHHGADITCGDIQALGMHMQFGGGQAGFIATADEAELVDQYPGRLYSITRTSTPGEWGFGEVAFERTSFIRREEGREWIGTTANLWGITAGVYLALMGPLGMRDIGEHLVYKAAYAAQRLDTIPGVRAPRFSAPHGKEFVVDVSATGHTVSAWNAGLLERGFLGGIDLGPSLGLTGHALFCVTEKHGRDDIEALADLTAELLV